MGSVKSIAIFDRSDPGYGINAKWVGFDYKDDNGYITRSLMVSKKDFRVVSLRNLTSKILLI